MTDTERGLLEEFGWTVECESPLEIRKGESFASNEAALMVIEQLRHQKEEEVYGDGA